jgi:hypothetical protein
MALLTMDYSLAMAAAHTAADLQMRREHRSKWNLDIAQRRLYIRSIKQAFGGNQMARTTEHQSHLETRHAYNDCRECRADTERQFVATAQWHYDHVHDYLAFAQPRIEAIKAGTDTVDSRIWLRDFRKAMDRRINLKVGSPKWRKLSDGYLERLRGMRHIHDVNRLRQFAQTGGWCPNLNPQSL